MRLLPSALTLTAFLFACGGPQQKDPPDSGGYEPDTSCGVDCVAQEHFGLTLGRCFEYSKSSTTKANPPDLSLFVSRDLQKAFLVEADRQAIEVLWRSGGGNLRGNDFFIFPDGALTLARRATNGSTSVSVTYFDEAGENISGVKWLDLEFAFNTPYVTKAQTRVSNNFEDLEYRVNTSVPDEANEWLTVDPELATDAGVKLIFGATPSDTSSAGITNAGVKNGTTVFVPNLGFTYLTPPPYISDPVPHYLQTVRDVGDGDRICGALE